MLGRQKQLLDAFMRVQDWLRRQAAAMSHPSVAPRLAELNEAVARAERAAAHQVVGLRSSQDATRSLRNAVRTLRSRHLAPISMIARALGDDVPIQHACRLPRRRVPVMLLVATAGGVRETATQYADVLIAHGRPPSFLGELDAAIAEVQRMVRRRDRATGLHVGATAALAFYLKRARKLVELLNCHVLTVFAEDEARLAEWRAARRVHLTGSRSRGEVLDTAPEQQDVAPPLKLVTAA